VSYSTLTGSSIVSNVVTGSVIGGNAMTVSTLTTPVTGSVNGIIMNYNTTFGTLYLGNTFPPSLASGANYNTFIGLDSGVANTTGQGNTLLGHNAGYWNQSGVNSVCLGFQAGTGVSGFSPSDNVYVGVNAGLFAVGSDNTCVGRAAGQGGGGSGATTYAACTLIGREAGTSLTTGNNNTFVGWQAGVNGTTGGANTYLGYRSGCFNQSGYYNTYLGYTAGFGVVAQSNIANTGIGFEALYKITTGGSNSALGAGAAYNNTVGNRNICFGQNAGYYNQTGNYNTYLGTDAGQGASGQSNSNNTAVGYEALYKITTGSSNSAIGFRAGYANTIGSNNNYLGFENGYYNETGDFNVYIGYQAGVGLVSNSHSNSVGIGRLALKSITTGGGNVAIGAFAGNSVTSGNNNIYLGAQAGNGSSGTVSNEIVIGGTIGKGSDTCIIKVENSGLYLSSYSAGTLTTSSSGQVIVSSDVRLKENIVYLPTSGSTATIMSMKPASFDFTIDPYKRYTGFIADDVLEVIPGCIDGKKYRYLYETDDEVDADGKITKHSTKPKLDADGNVIYKKDADGNLLPRYLGIDYNEITSRLVLAFQEQVGITQQQASEITLLKSQLVAQESKLATQESQFNQLLAWAKTQGFQ
jgi:hypothetical protein